MSSAEINDDFLDMLQALDEAKVEFIIVGAHALAAHGLPRATGDLDIFIRPSADNAVRTMAALEAFGAPIASHGVGVADFATPGNVYQIGLPPRRIDLLTEITGVSFDEAWASHTLSRFADRQAPFLGREALLKNKRATGRDKDLLDIKLLEKQRG